MESWFFTRDANLVSEKLKFAERVLADQRLDLAARRRPCIAAFLPVFLVFSWCLSWCGSWCLSWCGSWCQESALAHRQPKAYACCQSRKTILPASAASESVYEFLFYCGHSQYQFPPKLMQTFLIVVAVIVFLLITGIRIAQEYERGVVFRLGRYTGLRGPGLYWIIPLGIERSVTIDIRTQTVSAEQQETITRDSVTVKLNAVLWYRTVDAAKSVIAVVDARAAVYQLALTGLRNIIGQHDLDEVLQERDKINGLLRESIAGLTAPWGLEVERFEMKDVELPEAMQQVMAMQAEAIREKRARIIKAEAELEASEKLATAAAQMANNPAALELRRFQMISEVGAENNSTTVLMIPSDFVTLGKSLTEYLRERTGKNVPPKE